MSKPVFSDAQLDLFDAAARVSRARPRRLASRERQSLGLQPGVGYGEQDLDRQRYYRALETMIARETREANAELRPLTRLGLEGRVLVTPHPDAYTAHPDRPSAIEDVRVAELTVVRNPMATPLDYLFFQAKAPLAKWEWLTGKHFELDWAISMRAAALVASIDALALAKIDKPERRAKGEPIRPVTFRPKGPKRPASRGSSPSDAKLDAMARLGRLAGEISGIGFHLLREVIGKERWLKEVAGELGAAPEYIAQRFREALWEATRHYQMLPTARRAAQAKRQAAKAPPRVPEHRGGTYVMDELQQRAWAACQEKAPAD